MLLNGLAILEGFDSENKLDYASLSTLETFLVTLAVRPNLPIDVNFFDSEIFGLVGLTTLVYLICVETTLFFEALYNLFFLPGVYARELGYLN